LLGTGKRSVFKVLKENPDNFKDLSHLADCDVDVPVTAARRLVIKLYDSREKIKAEDEIWHEQMLVQDNPCSKHTQPIE
jgi:hypothetical protein